VTKQERKLKSLLKSLHHYCEEENIPVLAMVAIKKQGAIDVRVMANWKNDDAPEPIIAAYMAANISMENKIEDIPKSLGKSIAQAISEDQE